MSILMCFLILISNFYCIDISFASQTYFARIMQNDVYLYLTPIEADDFTNIIFSLPRTFFVQLIDNAGNDFFKVKYKDFYGYVKKDKVQAVVGTPETPYLEDINFRVFAELSRDMRSCPTTKNDQSKQIVYIPNLSRNLTYYGSIKGETLIDGRTDIWYYCKYSADKDYYGYVYSDFCDEMPKDLPTNNETLEYTALPDFEQQTQQNSALPLENKTTGIVIAILSIPACLFVYLIMRNSKIIATHRTKQKEIIDY